MRPAILALLALAAPCAGLVVGRTNAERSASAVADRSATPAHTHIPAGPGRAAPAQAAPMRPEYGSEPEPASAAITTAGPRARRRASAGPVERPSRAQAGAANQPAESGSTRASADTPSPPSEPLAITDMHVDAVSPSSVRITWRTSLPTRSQTAWGLLDMPTIWSDDLGSFNADHTSVLSGLSFSTSYTAWIRVVDEWNRAETSSISVRTASMPEHTVARTSDGRILLDDQPFFARAVWNQCSDGYGPNTADGINLFIGGGCGSRHAAPSELAGRAYSVVDAGHADTIARGVIGWFYPDEWDAYLPGGVSRADLQMERPERRPGRISFLTLTNHFYSRAEPLPQGKGMYPTLMSIPDVVGFDLYPLQSWCRHNAFSDVFDAQHELQSLSGGKPTFQWIEVTRMEQPCASSGAFDPTPETVRAETWLAIGGGAGAVGYFPNRWSRAIGDEIARTNRQIESLTPALLGPSVSVHSDAEASLRVSGRALNGALYVIAVNTTQSAVQARISLDGIAGRPIIALGGRSLVGAADSSFTDTFGPLAARVYVLPPPGWENDAGR